MKRSELNEIIIKKIDGFDETPELKGFLLEVLENELKNLHVTKGRFSVHYMQLADNMSQKETKNVDVRD